jgi:hypothetical protein
MGLTTNQLAYLAGFFDADGSVGLHLKDHRAHVRIQVAGIHHGSIQAFRDAFGGGALHLEHKPRCRPLWRWTASGSPARDALRQLLPYLTVKGPQAEAALELPIYHRTEHRWTAQETRHALAIAGRVRERRQEIA